MDCIEGYYNRSSLDQHCTKCSLSTNYCYDCLSHSGTCTRCSSGFRLYTNDSKQFISETLTRLTNTFVEENPDSGVIASFQSLECIDCYAVSGNCCPKRSGLNKVLLLLIYIFYIYLLIITTQIIWYYHLLFV